MSPNDLEVQLRTNGIERLVLEMSKDSEKYTETKELIIGLVNRARIRSLKLANHIGTLGHNPVSEGTKSELYRLLTLFLASRSMAELVEKPLGEEFDPIYQLQLIEETELSRLLLSLAVTEVS